MVKMIFDLSLISEVYGLNHLHLFW